MPKQMTHAWVGTFAANSLILLCGIATGILAARLLLPEGRGALATILFWPQLIASIGILSVNEAVTYRTGQAGANVKTILATGFWLAIGLAIVTGLIGHFLLPYLLGSERSEWLSLARAYLVAYLPLNFIALSLLAVDHGELRFKRYNLLRMMVPLVYLVGLIGLWIFNAVSVSNAVWVYWLGTFLPTIARIVLAGKKLAAKPSWRETKYLLTFGWRFHLAALLFILGSQADRLVVISLWDDATVGIYMVAFTVASAGLGIISQTFQVVLFPNISRQNSRSAQRELLASGLRYAVLLLLCVTLPLMALSPWLIPLLFGVAFRAAVLPAIILLLGYIPTALRQLIVRSLRGLGEGRPGTIAEALALAVFLLVSWPLGRQFGLAGIGLAFLVANAVALAYLTGYLQKRLGLALKDWWGLNAVTVTQVVHRSQTWLSLYLAPGR